MTSFWAPGLTGYLVRHPQRIAPLARAGWRLRRRGWWRLPPFLPLPPREYWAFRMSTAYGSSAPPPTPQAIVDAAEWSVRQRVGR